MTTSGRTFVLGQTHPRQPPLVPEVQLYLADEIAPLWELTIGQQDGPPPYWAFAWAGGQALARYVLDHPVEVAGKRVLDIATGSGLCAIAAMKAEASAARAADIDAHCADAVALNAVANGVEVVFTGHDLLLAAPPHVDLILAGDVLYEQPLAGQMLAWLHAAYLRGTRVLIGDPGRAHAPRAGTATLASYQVPTSRDVEDSVVKHATVFTFSG